MANFLIDNFSGSGTLESHSPDLGAIWHKTTAFGYTIASGKVYSNSTGGVAAYYNDQPAPGSDYDVSAIFTYKSMIADQAAYIYARCNAAIDTYYGFGYVQNIGKWILVRFVAGSGAIIGEYSTALSAGNNYAVNLRVVGDVVIASIDGSTIATYVDTEPIFNPGFIALGGQSSSVAMSPTTGIQLSALTATQIATPDAATFKVTGPAALRPGVASGNFKLTSSGNLNAAVTVTPSDDGAGGTFSPASVTLAAGTYTSATFTYTPPAINGYRQINFVNDSGLANPSISPYISSALLVDLFKGSGSLQDHAPDFGAAWRKGTTASGFLLGTNDVFCSVINTASTYYNEVVFPTANYSISADFIAKTVRGNQAFWLLLRSNTDGSTCYKAGYIGGTIYIIKTISGTATVLASAAFTPIAGVKYATQFGIDGSNMIFTLGDGLYLVATDGGISSVGNGGIAGQEYPDPATAVTSIGISTIVGDSYTIPVATAFKVLPPINGLNGLTSPLFYVRSNGSLAANVVVTPSDGGAGGTFSPASVALNAGLLAIASFTYTPASSGNKTFSYTNNNTLVNQANQTFTVLKSIPVTDAALYFSPRNSYTDGPGAMSDRNVRSGSTFVQALHMGWYAKINFSGPILQCLFDTTYNTVYAPTALVIIDDDDFTSIKLNTGETSLRTLASGLASGNHTCSIYLVDIDANHNTYTGTQGFRIKGYGIDPAAIVNTYVKKSLTIDYRGDSLTHYAPQYDRNGVLISDPLMAQARYLCESFGEYGTCGYSGSGWDNSYNAGTPKFPISMLNYFAGQPSIEIDTNLTIVNLGTNDGPSGDITSIVTAGLASLRSAKPTTKIILIIPFNQTRAAQITAGFNAAADTNSHLINLGAEANKGFGSEPSYYSFDGTHLTLVNQGRIAGLVVKAIQAILASGATTVISKSGGLNF